MTDRLLQPDTDFFENRRLRDETGHPDPRAELAADVRRQMDTATDTEEIEDLGRVLEYLAGDPHDSEGRDLGFAKTSFSTTELLAALALPPQRRSRYLRFRYQFNAYPRGQRLRSMPLLLAIEPTSVCNIKCVMCFQMDTELSGKRAMRGFMSRDLYTRILDEAAAKGVGGIVFASRGEPLLHKEITDFVRMAKAAGIPDVKLNTNAMRLTPQVSRELLSAGLDTLVFSVDSAVKEQFEAIRIGAKFERIVDNITEFHRIRNTEFPESRTRTRVSMVLVDSKQDVERATRVWRDLVDEFAVRWAIPRLGIYELGLRQEARPCSLLWERLYIWWDGVVNTCDEDYLSKLTVGQIAAEGGPTIEEVWTGSAMQNYREHHAAGAKNLLDPCRSCPGF